MFCAIGHRLVTGDGAADINCPGTLSMSLVAWIS